MKKGNSLLGAESGPGKYGGLSEPDLRLSKRQTALKRRKGKNAVCVGGGEAVPKGEGQPPLKEGEEDIQRENGVFSPWKLKKNKEADGFPPCIV